MTKARTYLELPPGTLDPATQQLLNDRLRTISARLDAITGGAGNITNSVTNVTQGGGSGLGPLILSVPGVIGIRSNATPLVTFQTAVNPTGLVGLLKQASVGGDVQVQLQAAGASFGVLTIKAGQTQGTLAVTATVAANTVLTLDVISVGMTFPGADLTVMVLF